MTKNNIRIEKEVHKLSREIEAIKARNRRVEADKAWETSKTRSLFIAFVTFALAFGLMMLIGEKDPFWKALIGSVAYLLSTTTYGILKSWWLKRRP